MTSKDCEGTRSHDGEPSGSHDLHGTITTDTRAPEQLCLREDGVPVVFREPPRTAEEARQRLREHEDACAVNGGELCPARLVGDAYGYRRACLIHAVLGDDWNELLATEAPPVVMSPEAAKYNEGLPELPPRYSTTADGCWLHAPTKGGGLIQATVQEFIAAGGSQFAIEAVGYGVS